MPAARAYSEATVIAVGIELEKSATVTPKSLHEALGGRGSRSTAITTWESFVEARGARPRRLSRSRRAPIRRLSTD